MPKKDFTQVALDVVRQATGAAPQPKEKGPRKAAPRQSAPLKTQKKPKAQ